MLLEKMAFCPICGSSRFPMSGLNECQELLVVRRKNEPEQGTLDLPGGFADMEETAEEGVIREVKEETGLEVTSVRYLFSFANHYAFSGVIVPTLDQFFACSVADTAVKPHRPHRFRSRFHSSGHRKVPEDKGNISVIRTRRRCSGSINISRYRHLPPVFYC